MKKQKMLSLYFKRSKLFLHQANGGEKRFVAGPTKEGPIQVPAWVTDTLTYQLSIKDGSIINLTPPEPTVVEAPAPVEKLAEHEATSDTNEDAADEEEVEEPEEAKQPSRAGKGSISSNVRRAR